MSEYIKENLIGIVSLLLAIVVPLFLYFIGKNRKELSYSILSSTSLIMNDDVLRKRFKIMFDEEEIKEEVHLVLVKIENTGNIPILAKDFEDDIYLDTSGEILIAEVKEKKPSNLKVKLNDDMFSIGRVMISPLLLNSNDEIIFKLLIRSYKNDLKVNSRIAGIKEIMWARGERVSYGPLRILYVLLTFTLAIYLESKEMTDLMEQITGIILGLTIMFVCTPYIIKLQRSIRQLQRRSKKPLYTDKQSNRNR